MITAIPVHGLCNRMLLLDSALALGRVLGREVHVVWRLGPDLNCRLERLFEPVPGIARVRTLPTLGGLDRVLLRAAWRWARWRGADAWRHRDLRPLSADPAALVERARKARHVLVRGDLRFFQHGPLMQGWRLVPALAARVEALAPRLATAVGVHVRRTDHARAIARSPLAAFERAMDAARAADPSTSFFVASDDPQVLAHLVGRYGRAVVHHAPVSFDRNDPRAIEAAAVDLYSLSRCRRILGTHSSTFSRVAAQLGSIPLELATDAVPA